MPNHDQPFRPKGPSISQIIRAIVEATNEVHRMNLSEHHRWYEYFARVFRWYSENLKDEIDIHETEQRILDFWIDPEAMGTALRVKLAAVFADHGMMGMARQLDPQTWNLVHIAGKMARGSGGAARINVLLNLLGKELMLELTQNDTKLGNELVLKLLEVVNEARVIFSTKGGGRPQRVSRFANKNPGRPQQGSDYAGFDDACKVDENPETPQDGEASSKGS